MNLNLLRGAVCLGLISVVLAGCGGDDSPSESPAAESDQGPLRVLTFAGYENDEFDEQFKAAYPDVDVEYVFGDSNDDFFSKLSTGAVDVDVVFGTCTNYLPDWVESGLIAEVDTSALTNWADANPDMEELGAVDGKQWQVVGYYGYDSLVVSDDLEPAPTSWQDLWSPDYKGKVSMIDYAENAVQMAALAWDYPYPDLSDDQLGEIKDKLLDLRENVRGFWQAVADPVQQLSGGEIEMFYGWPSQYAQVKDAGSDATYLEPSEGRLSWACGSLITADSEHKNLAEAWIDSRLSAESGANFVNANFLGHPNQEAMDAADQDVVTELGYNDPEVFGRSHPAVALTPEQRQKFTQMWSEVLAG